VSNPHVEACLAAIRERSVSISNVVRPLLPAQWQGPTNCPPWLVSDLASHIVISGRGHIGSIRRGLAGSVEPPAGGAHAHDEAGPAEVADALMAQTDAFQSLYDGLSDTQLDMLCFHRRGNRSVRWYAAHRLAEVTFHGWDLDVSLGREATLSTEVALLLLPTLLESNVPRTYAAGLSAERGNGERYRLIATDDASSSWLVTITPETLGVTGGPSDSEADLEIRAPAAMLALLVYGRANLRTCGATLEGDPRQVDRFAKIFPRP
jgi:uncharacterized protein (TIGR03083 family)